MSIKGHYKWLREQKHNVQTFAWACAAIILTSIFCILLALQFAGPITAVHAPKGKELHCCTCWQRRLTHVAGRILVLKAPVWALGELGFILGSSSCVTLLKSLCQFPQPWSYCELRFSLVNHPVTSERRVLRKWSCMWAHLYTTRHSTNELLEGDLSIQVIS